MNCAEYQHLSFQEKCVMIGQVVHLVQNDTDSFNAMASMLRAAGQQGKFDNVKIGPEATRENPCDVCDSGEYQWESTDPNGSMKFKCDECGNTVTYP